MGLMRSLPIRTGLTVILIVSSLIVLAGFVYERSARSDDAKRYPPPAS